VPSKKQLRPLKSREQYFVKLYIEAGADESKIPDCERRAKLRAGHSKKILKRKAVQEEIKSRLEAVRQEQFRSKVISEATTAAEARLQEKLADKVKRKKIDLEVLDHELMCGIEGLDWNRFPKEKLEAIKAGYVVFGTLESGNTRRLIPPEHLQQNQGQSTYSSLFERLALKSPSEPQLEARPAEDGVYDLIPQPATSIAPTGPFPPPGEPIQDSPPAAKSDPNIITVEVG
jgi:hypothetical protein